MSARTSTVQSTASRLMFLRAALFLAISVVTLPVPSHAALLLDFDFSFGGVTGTAFGLSDNATGRAQSVVVTGAAGAQGLPLEFVAPGLQPLTNIFTVDQGILTAVSFNSLISDNLDPRVNDVFTRTQLFLDSASGDSNFVSLLLRGDRFDRQRGRLTQARVLEEFSNVRVSGANPFSSTQVSEPSPIALLGAGVIAFGVLRRKKRNLE